MFGGPYQGKLDTAGRLRPCREGGRSQQREAHGVVAVLSAVVASVSPMVSPFASAAGSSSFPPLCMFVVSSYIAPVVSSAVDGAPTIEHLAVRIDGTWTCGIVRFCAQASL